MMSGTKKTICDLCGSSDLIPAYKPQNSRYEIDVLLCNDCGLAQSRKNTIPNKRVVTTSADADWGNIRHGKSLRFDAINVIIKLDELVYGNVLDIGSNRGDFCNWAIALSSVQRVLCVEPDGSLVNDYMPELDVKNERLENVDFEKTDKFNFIYSCQTLEHADSAFSMLEVSRSVMAEGGKMLIDIPSIAVISREQNLEEFFIDKHKFHFSDKTIRQFFDRIGLKVEFSHNDGVNLTYLVSSCDAVQHEVTASRDTYQLTDFELYSQRLFSNRAKLKRVVEERINPLLSRQKVAFWGAGRSLDALIKFGGLELGENSFVVDGYIAGKILINGNITVEAPSKLKLYEPDIIFVLAISAENMLAEKAYKMGIRHVIKLSEMLEQVFD